MIMSSFAGIAAGPGMSEVYAIAAVVDISNNEDSLPCCDRSLLSKLFLGRASWPAPVLQIAKLITR